MHIPWKTLAAAVALAAVIGGAVAFSRYRPLTLSTVQPERDVTIKVFGLGTVEARLLTRIGFKVSGTLIELRADHGDRVSAGQILAQIEASEQRAKLAKARAQVLNGEAAVQVAEAASRKSAAIVVLRRQVNQRRQALLAKQSVSVEAAEDAEHNEGIAKADLLVTQSEIEAAKAKLDDAKAQHDYEKVILAQHELRAPFDAVVVSRAKELGSVLSPGEALFTLVAPETIWTLAYVDEGRAGGIRVGQAADIKLRSLPQQMFKGKVTRVGLESDRVNEERRVYVSCEECPPEFFLGEQAEVFITTAQIDQALMVPETAIAQFDGAGGIIWAIENGRLQRRAVRFGHRSLDGRIEIAGGLPAGVQTPSAVLPEFRDGRAVRIIGPAP